MFDGQLSRTLWFGCWFCGYLLPPGGPFVQDCAIAGDSIVENFAIAWELVVVWELILAVCESILAVWESNLAFWDLILVV